MELGRSYNGIDKKKRGLLREPVSVADRILDERKGNVAQGGKELGGTMRLGNIKGLGRSPVMQLQISGKGLHPPVDFKSAHGDDEPESNPISCFRTFVNHTEITMPLQACHDQAC